MFVMICAIIKIYVLNAKEAIFAMMQKLQLPSIYIMEEW